MGTMMMSDVAEFQGADTRTKNSLRKLKFDGQAFANFETAMKHLRWACHRYGYRKDAWAHYEAPGKKLVFIMDSKIRDTYLEPFREIWKRYDRRLIGVSTDLLRSATVAQVMDTLKGLCK